MRLLVKPIITEKAISKIAEGKYIFQVKPQANKPEISKEIMALYKVDVIDINIINKKGKEKLIKGRYKSKKQDVKKAIVTLKKGQKIPGLEEK